ncbi:uncharacterized lipoprotein YddW (UPF0748 family) [Elusimicrobium posterum]|uniref:glycoside hydrolase family 10 protein n=1 Tax=Elusimicrobium posterum TaxID=3116653 RepID=UPI003C74B02A
MKKLFFAALFVLFFIPLHAQQHAAWITVLTNLDWPSKESTLIKDDAKRIEQQKLEFRHIINNFKDKGIKIVIMQVRPCSDRIWKLGDNAEPWSSYLTGTQGKDPGYDPLAFAIKVTHEAGMEFHAGINPFRINTNKDAKLAASHPAVKNPGLRVNYGAQAYYDPGQKEVRDLALKAIRNIVQNYNVDAIHLDDYFYPYKERDANTKEVLSFKSKNPNETADQRRGFVTDFVKSAHAVVKAENAKGKKIEFGVSPFAINKKGEIAGISQGTADTYNDMYADVAGWAKAGYVDYVVPQIYWSRTNKAAPFGPVLEWWKAFKKITLK